MVLRLLKWCQPSDRFSIGFLTDYDKLKLLFRPLWSYLMNRSVCSSRFKWSVAREIKFCYQTKNLKVSYWRGPQRFVGLFDVTQFHLFLKPVCVWKSQQSRILVSGYKRLKVGRTLPGVRFFSGATEKRCFGVSER